MGSRGREGRQTGRSQGDGRRKGRAPREGRKGTRP